MFSRKKPDPEPQPTWLKWAVLAFIVVAVIGNAHRNKPGESNPLTSALHKTESDIEHNQTVNFGSLRNRFSFDDVAMLHMRDNAPGHGEPAACGQEVSITYQGFLNSGKELDDKATHNKPLHFTIGEGKAMPALEQGVIGMKPGGKRSIISPYRMSYGVEDFARKDVPADTAARFDVELLSASPALPDATKSPYRIANTHEGFGASVICGRPAKFSVKVWNTDGTQLYTTDGENPLTFTPGKSEVFLGLEQGVLGMHQGGARTLVVPPSWQKTLKGNDMAVDFHLPKAQTVLVDVEALP